MSGLCTPTPMAWGRPDSGSNPTQRVGRTTRSRRRALSVPGAATIGAARAVTSGNDSGSPPGQLVWGIGAMAAAAGTAKPAGGGGTSEPQGPAAPGLDLAVPVVGVTGADLPAGAGCSRR